MQEYNFSAMDVAAIERKARKLRAEATANAVNAMVAWVKSRFASRPARGGQAA